MTSSQLQTPILPGIKWENENTGMETSTSGSQMRVNKRERAITEACSDYVRQLVAKPKNLQSKTYQGYREYSFAPLPSARPKFSGKEMQDIICIMDRDIPGLLTAFAKDKLEHSLDDFTFLLSLGLKRNWKSECVICLSDEMMGTTCGCGHTEIVVFRPCGHSACAYPCFDQYIKSKELNWFMISGQTYITSVKYDITQTKTIKCPTCNVNVDTCFKAEDVYAPQDILNMISKFIIDLVKLELQL